MLPLLLALALSTAIENQEPVRVAGSVSPRHEGPGRPVDEAARQVTRTVLARMPRSPAVPQRVRWAFGKVPT